MTTARTHVSPCCRALALAASLLSFTSVSTAVAQERETFQLTSLPRGPINSMALSGDDKYLALVGNYYTLILWDLRAKKAIGSLEGDDKIAQFAVFSPDGGTLATSSKEVSVKLWEVPSLKLKRTLGDRNYTYLSLAYSPNGKVLATGGGEKKGNGFTGLIKLWDIKTGAELKAFRGHTRPVNCLAFSKDSQTLVSGAYDGAVKVWDVKSGKEKASFKAHRGPVYSLDVSPDGKLVAASGKNGVIALIDLKAGEVKRPLTSHYRLDVKCVRFSPDGKLLVSSNSYGPLVWDVAAGKLMVALEGHKESVESLAFSRDGKTIITAAFDHTVKFWDTPKLDDE